MRGLSINAKYIVKFCNFVSPLVFSDELDIVGALQLYPVTGNSNHNLMNKQVKKRGI